MFDQPKLPLTSQRHTGGGMLLHAFTRAHVTYEVRFTRMDGHWFASLHVAGERHSRPLLPWPDDIPAGVSSQAIRAGYISSAEWLVTTGRWPDPETRSLYAEQALARQAA